MRKRIVFVCCNVPSTWEVRAINWEGVAGGRRRRQWIGYLLSIGSYSMGTGTLHW